MTASGGPERDSSAGICCRPLNKTFHHGVTETRRNNWPRHFVVLRASSTCELRSEVPSLNAFRVIRPCRETSIEWCESRINSALESRDPQLTLNSSFFRGFLLSCSFVFIAVPFSLFAQGGHPNPSPSPPAGVKEIKCHDRKIPQLQDITAKSGIQFEHLVAPEQKYILESMSGGVLLVDYDRDGWVDIYFTNAPTLEMAKEGQKARAARFTTTITTASFTGMSPTRRASPPPCFANGGAVGDYNNDGWPDIYVTCVGGNVLYRNNGDGTFTDVTAKAGVADGRWSTGAAFGDYDGDGLLDLMVANYVEFDLANPPAFGKGNQLQVQGDRRAVRAARRLKGSGDSLFHNNGDGTFSTCFGKSAGVDDPGGYYGLGVIWSDFNNTGHPDIYVANDSTPSYLYKNTGKGKFEDIGLESGTALSEDGNEQAFDGNRHRRLPAQWAPISLRHAFRR